MANPFTNVHIHIFNDECIPDRFLRILAPKFIRQNAPLIQKGLETKVGKFLVRTLAWAVSKDKNRGTAQKMISFLDIGTRNSQKEVFEIALAAGKITDSQVRIIALTLNMDYMDSQPSSARMISFETQLAKVMEIKRFYPHNIFPFLGVDPRHKSGTDMLNWAKKYFETGLKVDGKTYPYFCGIKLYPALGYFPFDARLHELYQYAEAHNIPVMTHCTRVGNQYVGNAIENLIPDAPKMIPFVDDEGIKDRIYARIKRFREEDGWIKNSDNGDNDFACDLFGHPENYIPLAKAYPNLKICIAHIGGSSEIDRTKINAKDKKAYETLLKADDFPNGKKTWFDYTIEVMKAHPNIYTDISYTLSDFEQKGVPPEKNVVLQRVITELLLAKDNAGKPLSRKVLFGTDFFMTEQEKHEAELYASTQATLAPWMDAIARENPQEFIMQPL